MVTGALLYITTSFIGVNAYKHELVGLNFANLAEIVIYSGTFLLTIPVALRNVYLSYKEGTGKMRPFLEATRPLLSLFAQMVLCWIWVLASKNNILELDPRCFFYMSGTLYSNIVARLIVAQMSSQRCELFSPGLLPLTASVAISILIPGLPKAGELAVLYGLTALLTAFHLHYAVCVLNQLCHHLNINCFKIKPKDLNGCNGAMKMSTGGKTEDNDRLLNNQEDLDSLSSDSDEIAHYDGLISVSTGNGPGRSNHSSSSANKQEVDADTSEVFIASGSGSDSTIQASTNLVST